jgi:hypothetical protein
VALSDKKLPPDIKPDESLSAEIQTVLDSEGTVSCAAAVNIAQKMGVDPSAVGQTLDALGIHLSRCQLGLFGFPGHAKGWEQARIADQPVPEGLRAALRNARDSEGRLSCAAIWKTADRFRAPRVLAGFVADQDGFKIVGCQLGAF